MPGDTNTSGGDTNGFDDVFLWSLAAGFIGRVDNGPGNPQPDGDSYEPSLSGDGRYVAFTSEATNWVAGDTNGVEDVFVHDRVAGTTVRVSVATGGAQGNGPSTQGWISEDGRYVVFGSDASNRVAGDANGWMDVFRHDLLTGETELLSRSTAGDVGGSLSFYPSPSSDGLTVAFGSHASNLVPGDTNFEPDVFLRWPGPPPEPYCPGLASLCPCGNGGFAPNGCRNSAYVVGARLDWLGSTDALADDLVLDASRLVPGQPALAFAGTSQVNGGQGAPFGDGLRCAGGGVVRLGVQTADAFGGAQYGPGLGATGGWLPGDRRHFQVWYRDPGGPCGGGFNFTSGLRVDFGG